MANYTNHTHMKSSSNSTISDTVNKSVYVPKYSNAAHRGHIKSDTLSQASSSVSERKAPSIATQRTFSDIPATHSYGNDIELSSDSDAEQQVTYTPNKYTHKLHELQLSNISPVSPNANIPPVNHANVRSTHTTTTVHQQQQHSVSSDKLETQLTESNKLVQSLKHELQSLREQALTKQQSLTAECHTVKAERDTYKQHVQQYKTEIETLHNTIKQQKQREDDLLLQLRNQTIELQSQRSQSISVAHTPRESVDLNNRYIREVAVVEERNKALQLQLSALSSELAESKRAANEALQQCTQHDTETLKLHAEINKLREQRDIMLTQHTELCKSKDDTIVQYKTELQHLRYDSTEQIATLNNINKSMQTTIEQLQSQYADMKHRLQTRDDELRSISRSSSTLLHNHRTDSITDDMWREQKHTHSKQVSELQAQLHSAVRNCDTVKLQKEELDKQVAVANSAKKELSDRCRDIELKLYEAIEQRTVLQQQVDALTKQLSTASGVGSSTQCGSSNGCYASRVLENQLNVLQTQYNTLQQRYNTVEQNEQIASQQCSEYQHKHEVECLKHETVKKRNTEYKQQCEQLSTQLIELTQQLNNITHLYTRFDAIDNKCDTLESLLHQVPQTVVQYGVDYISHDNTLDKYKQQVELMSPAATKRQRKTSVTGADKPVQAVVKPPLAFGSNVPRSQQVSVLQQRRHSQPDTSVNTQQHDGNDSAIHMQIGQLFGSMNGVLIEHIQSVVQQTVADSLQSIQDTIQSTVQQSTHLQTEHMQQISHLQTAIHESVTGSAEQALQAQRDYLQQLLDTEFNKHHTTNVNEIKLLLSTLCSTADVQQVFAEHATQQAVSQTVIDNLTAMFAQLQASVNKSVELSSVATLQAQNDYAEKLGEMLGAVHTSIKHNTAHTTQADTTQYATLAASIEQLQQSVDTLSNASFEKQTAIQAQLTQHHNDMVQHIDATHKQLCDNITDRVDAAEQRTDKQHILDVMHNLHTHTKQVVRDTNQQTQNILSKQLAQQSDVASTQVDKLNTIYEQFTAHAHSVNSQLKTLHATSDAIRTQVYSVDVAEQVHSIHDKLDAQQQTNTDNFNKLHAAVTDSLDATSKIEQHERHCSQTQAFNSLLDTLHIKLDKQAHTLDNKLHTLHTSNETMNHNLLTQLQQLTKQNDLYHICEIIQSHITAALYGLPAELHKSLMTDINNAINTSVKAIVQQQTHELSGDISAVGTLLTQLRMSQENVAQSLHELPTSKQLHDMSFNTSHAVADSGVSKNELSRLYDHITGIYDRLNNLQVPNMQAVQQKLDEVTKMQSSVLAALKQCATYQHVTDEQTRTQNTISIMLGNIQQQQSLQTETIRSIQQYSQQQAVYQQSQQLEKSLADTIQQQLSFAPTYGQLSSLSADVKQLVQQHGLTQAERDSIAAIASQLNTVTKQLSDVQLDALHGISAQFSDVRTAISDSQRQLTAALPSKDELCTLIDIATKQLTDDITANSVSEHVRQQLTALVAEQQAIAKTVAQLPTTFYETERSLSYVMHQQTQNIKKVIDDVADRQEELCETVNTLVTQDTVQEAQSAIQSDIAQLSETVESMNSANVEIMEKYAAHYLEAMHQRVHRIVTENNSSDLIQAIHSKLHNDKVVDRSNVVEADLTQAQLHNLHEKLDSLADTVINNASAMQTPTVTHRPSVLQTFNVDNDHKHDMTASIECNSLAHSRKSSSKTYKAHRTKSKNQSIFIDSELKSETVDFDEATQLIIDTTSSHTNHMRAVELSPLPMHHHHDDELAVTVEDSSMEVETHNVEMIDAITSPMHTQHSADVLPAPEPQSAFEVIHEEDTEDVQSPTVDMSPAKDSAATVNELNITPDQQHAETINDTIDFALNDIADDVHTVQTVLEVMWRFLRKVVVRSIEDMQIQQAHMERLQHSGESIEINESDVVIDINDTAKFNDLLQSIPYNTQQSVQRTLDVLSQNGFTPERLMADITNDVNAIVQQYMIVHNSKLFNKNVSMKQLGWSCAAILFGSLMMSNNSIDTFHA